MLGTARRKPPQMRERWWEEQFHETALCLGLRRFWVRALSARVFASKLKERHRPKKGRPTADQVSKINSVILAVATERFLADGYADTSMDAIAASAKVSKGTLYSRYPDKEALLRAVVEDRVAAWSAIAPLNDWMAGKTLEQRLKHHLTTIVTWATRPEVRAFDRLLDGAPEASRALYEIRYSRTTDFLANEIRELTAADARPARDPRRIAATLMAAIAGWLRLESMVRKVSARDGIAFAHDTIDLLIAGRAEW